MPFSTTLQFRSFLCLTLALLFGATCLLDAAEVENTSSVAENSSEAEASSTEKPTLAVEETHREDQLELILRKRENKIKLRSHEPNLIGYRKDNNDVAYMDFKVSLLYPMLHDGEPTPLKTWGYFPKPYFAFTARFAQYISTRESSPVIAKRFNPKMIGRYWLSSSGEYFDIALEHESNGQSINTAAAFQRKRADLIASGEDPEYARDYISRGWDLLTFTYKKKMKYGEQAITSYFEFKYFLFDGPLQGATEEASSWEGLSQSYPRGEYDGISIHMTSKMRLKLGPIRGTKSTLSFSTGYLQALKHSTFQLEATTLWWDFPVTVWAASGYNSDLVDYYQHVNSIGIAFELKTLSLFSDGDFD